MKKKDTVKTKVPKVKKTDVIKYNQSVIGAKKESGSALLLIVVLAIIAVTVIGVKFLQDRANEKTEAPAMNTPSVLEMAVDYKDSWAADDLTEAIKLGIMSGTSLATVSPEGGVTRSQFVVALYKLDDGKTPSDETNIRLFGDVLDNFYYTDAINWASSNRFVEGSSPTSFQPNHLMTRAQACVVLYKYHSKIDNDGKDYSKEKTKFIDENYFPGYADNAIKWACATGIIDYIDNNKFGPNMELTRAELARIMMNYYRQFVIAQ